MVSNTTPWSPSARERERESYRKNLQARKRVIALISTVLVLGTFSAILLTSPGWDSVKATFFDLDYGREVFPTVIRGLVINIQLTLIGGLAIGIIALALALLKTTKSPALTPFRFIATAYIDIFRGAPLILIILLVGFGVPALRIQGLTNFVSLLKDTGLVSILGVTDAVRAAQINASRTFNYTPYVVAAILFLLITIPLTRFIDRQIRLRSEKQNSDGLA